ncbi:MAG: hypothetical protein LBU34_09855 [Planctomycetaceae bacterium]|jgi:hypothetical protein|nr:hypothetical protein [Planctomycetaceae bacterium]
MLDVLVAYRQATVSENSSAKGRLPYKRGFKLIVQRTGKIKTIKYINVLQQVIEVLQSVNEVLQSFNEVLQLTFEVLQLVFGVLHFSVFLGFMVNFLWFCRKKVCGKKAGAKGFHPSPPTFVLSVILNNPLAALSTNNAALSLIMMFFRVKYKIGENDKITLFQFGNIC